MKVAANEDERIVMLAQTEVEQNSTAEKSSLDSLIEAFKRAAQLRDTPLFAALVKGVNDGVSRMVLVTTQEKLEGGCLRYLCLLPYTELEERNRRRTSAKYLPGRAVRSGPPAPPTALLPSFYHELWIRKDRLTMV